MLLARNLAPISKGKTCFLRKIYENILERYKLEWHYENMPIQIYWKILPPKTENFRITKSENFHISAPNIDCWYSLEPPRRGGSNEYPQSMFLSRNMKNIVYPCNLQFYYIKVGLKGVKNYKGMFLWWCFKGKGTGYTYIFILKIKFWYS